MGFDMLAQKDPYIESAYEHLQVISQDREKRLEYEARQKAIRDHNQMMREAEERGREAGERIGREAGERTGREAGERIGREAGEKRAGERINKLHSYLIREKRFGDLERSASDENFQKQLMEQYGI